MVSKAFSMGLFGMHAFKVEVECDLSAGLPAFDLVGLPDAAVKESRPSKCVWMPHGIFKTSVLRTPASPAMHRFRRKCCMKSAAPRLLPMPC